MAEGVRRFAPAVAAALFAFPALANDSTAELTTGGLVLTRSDHIEMRAEDLAISTRQIRVSYRFLNTSAADVRTVVAFPMPDIEAGYDMDVAIPNTTSDNLLNFHTTVDKRPVSAALEQKALLKGVDHTARLKRLGVPLSVNTGAPGAAMDALPEADKAELLRLGLAELEEFDAGKGWERHMAPRWTLKTTYYWEQVFPAGREIAVEHIYEPSVGGSVETAVGAAWATRADAAAMRAKYCTDDSFLSAVAARRKVLGGEASGLMEQRIGYVLTTGANWKKPIGEFRLTVDKERPDNLVSFCADGVRKTSPTTFEVRHANFTPKRDLHILIVTTPTARD